MKTRKSLIEEWFPVRELSRDAAIEMAYKSIPAYIRHCRELKISENRISREFYDPKIRNLHPWFARRPCSAARATTLAAILPASVDKELFMKAVGWMDKPTSFVKDKYPPILFYTDPDRNLIDKLVSELHGRKTNEIVVCDPMAGGGTIPLEGLRLGCKSIGIDYNPMAYLILKATVEYPSKFGKELAEGIRKESNRLIARERAKLGKFYPEGSEGYIIARGIKCPHCKGLIPLLHKASITNSAFVALKFDSPNKPYKAAITRIPQELPYKKGKRTEIICPYCNEAINKKQAYTIWTRNHRKLLHELKEGTVNKADILQTHILLVRQNKKAYTICNKDDEDCFLNACKELAKSFKDMEFSITRSEIPSDNKVFAPLRKYGIKYWYELFNPRQLLALMTLTKYVHDKCELAISEHSEIDIATLVYLAFSINRVADYNSIATTWKKGTIRDTIGSYAQGRRVTYSEGYCEAIVPYRNLEWVYESNLANPKRTQGGIYPILSELCKRLEGLEGNVQILHGDCRSLSSLLNGTSIDVINVDPPYFDQHIYSDISEYFWHIVKTALNPLIQSGILFKQGGLDDWSPMSSFVPREGEIIVRKERKPDIESEKDSLFSEEWYAHQMGVFFKECHKILRKDGIVLTWFTHRSLEAWKAIISSLYAGGFYIVKTWPITTELLTRLVSRGKSSALNRTLIIVSRKRNERVISEKELKEHTLDLMESLCQALQETGASELELFTFLKASAICAMTEVEPPGNVQDPIEHFMLNLVPKAMKLADEFYPILKERFIASQAQRPLEDYVF